MTSKPAAAIVPHASHLVKGIDICGNATNIYIIRSDLGCYMKCDSIHLDYPPSDTTTSTDKQKSDMTGEPQKYEIHPLHPSCTGGDHYMIGPDDNFYIIKGDHFICVSDLSLPMKIPIKVQSLSEHCRDGDNYLYYDGHFYIIKKDEYTLVSDLTGEKEEVGKILDNYQDGAYFFGAWEYIYIISQVPEWGVTFTITKSLRSSDSAQAYFVYPGVVNFLPGGLSVDIGITVPKWELVKSFTNSSNATLQWSENITVTKGYNKSHFQSIENNWSTSTTTSIGTTFEYGSLVTASLEMQFSLTESYGGAQVRTDQEDWNEAYETEEKLSTSIPPSESVYIWQFRLGLKGSKDVLFCRDLEMTDSHKPPTSMPLPIANV